MNPAYSIIFFTVSSGAGYGLLALLGLAASSHGKASSMGFAVISVGIALILIVAGLLSSTAHLGRPERAWRALSQWRSSWLSREGIAAIATFPAALGFAATWSGIIDAPVLIAPFGIVSALLSMITVFCTGMIYASLKTIPAWHTQFTVPTYVAFALATGSGLLNVIAFVFGRFQTDAGRFMAFLTIILIFAAIVLKWLYWRMLRANDGQYSMADATGLGPSVRQWEVPHTSTNFIMKEMGYQVARSHGRKLQRLCMILLDVGFFTAFVSPRWPWLVFITATALLVAAWVERWLFFAQGEHVVQLFYGKQRV